MAKSRSSANVFRSAANPDLHCRMNCRRATAIARAGGRPDAAQRAGLDVNANSCGCSWRAGPRPHPWDAQGKVSCTPGHRAPCVQVRQTGLSDGDGWRLGDRDRCCMLAGWSSSHGGGGISTASIEGITGFVQPL